MLRLNFKGYRCESDMHSLIRGYLEVTLTVPLILLLNGKRRMKVNIAFNIEEMQDINKYI